MKELYDIRFVALSLILVSGCSSVNRKLKYQTISVCEITLSARKYKHQTLIVRGILKRNGFDGLELEGYCPERKKINLGRGGDIPKQNLLVEGEAQAMKDIETVADQNNKNAKSLSRFSLVVADVEIKFDVDKNNEIYIGQVKIFKHTSIYSTAL